MRISISPEMFKAVSVTEWDDEQGELVRTDDILGQKIRDVIKVRARLEDDIARAAVILELERQGYTVLSPEA